MNPQLAPESVWDYPRPPRLEPWPHRIRIAGPDLTLADTTSALRILETSHPPVYYIPPAAVDRTLLRLSSARRSFCEWKGMATYWDLVLPGGVVVRDAGWSYEQPATQFAALAGHLAFYASRLAAAGLSCFVADETVIAQPGDFYGGWITSNLRGPFKGAPGTSNW